ncbi:MAG: hypothetical protein LIP00_03730 [Parabacteroides sp.]|nr:hypothetical protein [Parabacteroides sp.]
MDTLSTFFRLELKQAYYRDGRCRDIGVSVPPDTRQWLTRRNIRFHSGNTNEWYLTGDTSRLGGEKTVLRFDLVCRDPHFFYRAATGAPGTNEVFAVRIATGETCRWQVPEDITGTELREMPGEIGRIYLAVNGEAAERTEASVVFSAAEQAWEYVFIPRNGNAKRSLSLEERNNRLAFTPMKTYEFMGVSGWKCQSETRVVLQESYDYQLRLTEQTPFGQKTLVSRLPHPVPGRFSDAARGCIRDVVYF